MPCRLQSRRIRWAASATALLATAWIADAHADASRPGDAQTGLAHEWAFKFTPSWYRTSHEPGAIDLNLRANHGPHALWIGEYRRAGGEFEQTRAGYEHAWAVPFGKLVPSVMVATRGFVGGAVNAEFGDRVFALAGFGRTNRRDFYNLNFDPNDAVTFGLGTRPDDDTTWLLYRVQDDRLDTGQRITHLAWRRAVRAGGRWSVDLSYKHGSPTADAPAVSGSGLSVTFDRGPVFVRAAWEEKVNFSVDDMLRLSVGFRF